METMAVMGNLIVVRSRLTGRLSFTVATYLLAAWPFPFGSITPWLSDHCQRDPVARTQGLRPGKLSQEGKVPKVRERGSKDCTQTALMTRSPGEERARL